MCYLSFYRLSPKASRRRSYIGDQPLGYKADPAVLGKWSPTLILTRIRSLQGSSDTALALRRLGLVLLRLTGTPDKPFVLSPSGHPGQPACVYVMGIPIYHIPNSSPRKASSFTVLRLPSSGSILDLDANMIAWSIPSSRLISKPASVLADDSSVTQRTCHREYHVLSLSV